MSKVQRNDMAGAIPQPSAAPALPIGEPVLAVLTAAYRARRPVLLEGPTGIGKSQITAEFAQRAGIEHRVLDLSLLEPPDLVGLPQLRDGRTHYAFPAELPTEGSGVLMLEELNRAEIPVMQPALQLLSARRLHAYELPPGWFCVAAINPEQDDYQVNRLDAALRSRFLQVVVRADRQEWLRWAVRANVHPLVQSVVAAQPTVFETSAPRSWAYAGEVLGKLLPAELAQRELVLALARGFLPISWATALTEALAGLAATPQLDPTRCFAAGGERYLADLAAPLTKAGRTDALAMFAFLLRQSVPPPDFPLPAWERLLTPLPGDLRQQVLLDVQRRSAR
ncbi:MAG: AAA family ATPase [Planctomycetes bacterium]|nr:AAA family ATPase [Planctomycetota bacterium]